MKKLTYFVGALILFAAPVLHAADDLEPAPMPPDQGFWQTFVMIGVALAFFYFMLWRPEQKRRKEMEAQRSALKKGDRVTAMGIIGTVVKVQENTVILKMYDGSQVEFVKGAINEILPPGTSAPEKVEE